MLLPAIRQLALATTEVPIKVSPMATGMLKQPEPDLATVNKLTVIVIDIAAEPGAISAIIPMVTPNSGVEPDFLTISEG